MTLIYYYQYWVKSLQCTHKNEKRFVLFPNKQNYKKMQNKINKAKQKQQTWSQIIKLIESANLEESEQLKRSNLNRKKAYGKQLNIQMSEQQERILYHQNQKIKQRAQIQEQVRLEKLSLNQSKIKRIKTQQKYQEQNAQLAHQDRRKTQDQIKYGQNPFVNLVDKQDMRARQTRFNFQLQNKLNDIQIQLQKQMRTQVNELDTKVSSEFKNYIQNQHKKHQNERQIFKKKYLIIKKWQKSNQNSNLNEKQDKESSLQKKYIRFLDDQVSQLKTRKYKQQRILDRQLSQINKSVELPDSSPAFLGRLPYSNDRKKQLQILDNNLSKNSYKIRPVSQLYHSMKVSPRERFNSAFDEQTLQRKVQSNTKLLPTLTKEKNEKSIQQTINRDNIALPQRQRKKYTKYDIIMGRHKTIII